VTWSPAKYQFVALVVVLTQEGTSNSSRTQSTQHQVEWAARGDAIFGESHGDHCGVSLDMDRTGKVLAVGSTPYNGTAGEEQGNVRVFDFKDNVWILCGDAIEGENAGD
jgi:hypothetical protein